MVAERGVAIITGASGGMGRSLGRAFGTTRDLVLTDIAAGPLDEFAQQLRGEGYTLRAVINGDLSDDSVLTQLAMHSGETASAVLLHTAALSPALAKDWQSILSVNLVATEKLLMALEHVLPPGSVAIIIASMAAHTAPALSEIDAILDDPLHPDLLERLRPHLKQHTNPADRFEFGSVSYGLSKRAVMRMCATRAAKWAQRGMRIVSISPGTIWTPMGRREAEANPLAAAVVDATPAGRWGTVMDITAAAQFLSSEAASFITGTDLRVDGGVTPFLLQQS